MTPATAERRCEVAASNVPQPDSSVRRPRRQRDQIDQLERHLAGLRAHLEAIGLRAEAAAVLTELELLRAAR